MTKTWTSRIESTIHPYLALAPVDVEYTLMRILDYPMLQYNIQSGPIYRLRRVNNDTVVSNEQCQ